MGNQVENLRVGVYVDVANISMNGGNRMQYDVLRNFACRGSAIPVRLNAYLRYDAERARRDESYSRGQHNFHDKLREQGFKVILKHIKWYMDDTGNPVGKANSDLDMAVDALLQSDKLDRVLLATGDGDFTRVVRALQNSGCRVEIVAFDNVSTELRREADMYISGYLIPNLQPISQNADEQWGKVGSLVRGVCYYFNQEKKFGFLRFLKGIGAGLWDVDPRLEGSPYNTAYFHASEISDDRIDLSALPNRDHILQFHLKPSRQSESEFEAREIALVAK